MKKRSRDLCLVVSLIAIFQATALSQNPPPAAETNPLSTIIYLLSRSEKGDKGSEKACLAASLAEVERHRDVESTLQTIEPHSFPDVAFVNILNELISRGKVHEASTLFSILVKRFDGDEDLMNRLGPPAIKLDRVADLRRAIEKFDDSDRIELWHALATDYTDRGRTVEALEVLQLAVPLVEKSEYGEDKADLALLFARLKQPELTRRFTRLAMIGLEWKGGEPEYAERRIIDRVIEVYRLTGQNAEADELLVRQGKPRELLEAPSLTDTAQKLIRDGNLKEASRLLSKARAIKGSDVNDMHHGLGDLFDAYLGRGEAKNAETIVKRIDHEYTRQDKLMMLADHLAKTRNRPKARELLIFALDHTDRIDISKPEDGALWTSDKWNQAKYQAAIATRMINMRFDKEALSLINRLTKPYLRASMLREYVSANRSRMPEAKLAPHLEEAVFLLRKEKTEIFDSRRFDVYGAVARSFAEIGMAKRSNEVFAEALTLIDRLAIDTVTDSALLYVMCSLGVEFDKAKIEADENVRTALRRIIRNWENDEY